MQAYYEKHFLDFKIPARTSRGAYTSKEVYLLYLVSEGVTTISEASPLPDLSIDKMDQMESKLAEVCTYINENNPFHDIHDVLQLQHFPSIQFALECGIAQLKHKEPNIVFPSSFTEKKTGIPINGLIWMAEIENMLQQVESKIEAGYECIKLKIGALDFDAECRLLEIIRKKYSAHKITLRVDANGAFAVDEALPKLKDLSRFELHSIEQPIKPGQYDAMQEICASSKIPVALDEELIGVNAYANAEQLIRHIKPQYLILKPTLLGGFTPSDTWIKCASKFNAGWWVTSALESNIGLNAIAQYCGKLEMTMPQGLGTGALYVNNFKENTFIENGLIFYK
jgi:o-succinylbenzoate synthase